MGWASMNRLAAEVCRAAGERGGSLLPLPQTHTPEGSRLQRMWMRYVTYPRIIRSKVRSGLLHVLDHSFADLLSYARPGVKTVASLYDLIPLVAPGGLRPAQQERFRRTVGNLRRADAVVCCSDYTRDEAVRLLGIKPERLHVVSLGATELPLPCPGAAARAASLPPFFLSVGSVLLRKNLKLLPAILSKLPAPTLVRIGQTLPSSLADEIRHHATLIELGSVSDAELAAWYRHATATLVPSTHEGFGLPVVEAMLVGCPVVCSNATSLPEAGGDAALYFDPTDPAAAAEACLQLLNDKDARARVAEASRSHARRFTWQAYWDRLQGVYQKLVPTWELASRQMR
jgi:glycosyltransferase involved in cell wall biosynthesis